MKNAGRKGFKCQRVRQEAAEGQRGRQEGAEGQRVRQEGIWRSEAGTVELLKLP